jgi:hypothetical protein
MSDTQLASIPEAAYTPEVVNFSFRSKEENGVKTKRETLKFDIPHITWTGLTQALSSDPKVREFMISVVNNEIDNAVRAQLNDNEKLSKAEELDYTKLNLVYLANQPKSERAGNGISQDTWKAFQQDYISVMPALINRSAEQIATAAKVFTQRLQPVKTNKPVLSKLEEYLTVWFTNTETPEDFADVFTFLSEKIKVFLNTSDEDMLKNI